MKKILLLIVVSTGLLLSSCYKEPENGIAKITIVSSVYYRQPGVDVHLYGPPTSYIDMHLMTNFNGEVVYEHDPSLEVILNVHATYTDPSSVFHEVYGIIRIMPDEKVEETFVLNP
jgi:hypothetical protein